MKIWHYVLFCIIGLALTAGIILVGDSIVFHNAAKLNDSVIIDEEELSIKAPELLRSEANHSGIQVSSTEEITYKGIISHGMNYFLVRCDILASNRETLPCIMLFEKPLLFSKCYLRDINPLDTPDKKEYTRFQPFNTLFFLTCILHYSHGTGISRCEYTLNNNVLYVTSGILIVIAVFLKVKERKQKAKN